MHLTDTEKVGLLPVWQHLNSYRHIHKLWAHKQGFLLCPPCSHLCSASCFSSSNLSLKKSAFSNEITSAMINPLPQVSPFSVSHGDTGSLGNGVQECGGS